MSGGICLEAIWVLFFRGSVLCCGRGLGVSAAGCGLRGTDRDVGKCSVLRRHNRWVILTGAISQVVFLHFFFFCLRMWRKKMELKGPETPHPWETQHLPSPPPKNAGISMLQTSASPNHVAEAGAGCHRPSAREQSTPIVPIARLLHVRLAHNLQSPDIPSHTRVRESQSAMRRQEQPPVQGVQDLAVQWRSRQVLAIPVPNHFLF